MHHTFMHAHTLTHNLWFWLKCPPLAFSVAEMSAPKRPRPKCPWLKCPTFPFTMPYSKLYILTEVGANDVRFISVDRQKLDLLKYIYLWYRILY